MPWFYNDHSGALSEQSGISEGPYVALLHAGIGWHEYATEALALADIKRHNWPPPFNAPALTPPGKIATGVGNAISQALGFENGLPGLLPAVTNRSFVLRVIEVTVGAALVIVGVVKLTEGTKLESVGKTVGKAAPFLL